MVFARKLANLEICLKYLKFITIRLHLRTNPKFKFATKQWMKSNFRSKLSSRKTYQTRQATTRRHHLTAWGSIKNFNYSWGFFWEGGGGNLNCCREKRRRKNENVKWKLINKHYSIFTQHKNERNFYFFGGRKKALNRKLESS